MYVSAKVVEARIAAALTRSPGDEMGAMANSLRVKVGNEVRESYGVYWLDGF